MDLTSPDPKEMIEGEGDLDFPSIGSPRIVLV
jgi:hypothetical protein